MSAGGTASRIGARANDPLKQTTTAERRTKKPVLLFFTQRTSGPARRMASLVAWIKVTQRRRLQVVEVDVDRHSDLARQLHVADVPTLVLVASGQPVDRLEGRVTGSQIDRMIDPYLS